MLWGSGSRSSGARFKFSVSLKRSVMGLAYSFNLERERNYAVEASSKERDSGTPGY